MSRLIGRILIILALGAGPLGLAAYGVYLAVDANNQDGWPTTSGRVIRTEVVGKTDRSLQIEVRYQYIGAGRSHEGRDVIGVPATEHRVPEMYGDGAPIDVLYNPTDPARSVLETAGYGPAIYYLLLAGIALTLVGLPLAFFASLVFAEVMLIKARFHMRRGRAALEEGMAAAARAVKEGDPRSEEIAPRAMETFTLASEAEALLREVEEDIQPPTNSLAASLELPASQWKPFFGYGWFWRGLAIAGLLYGLLCMITHLLNFRSMWAILILLLVPLAALVAPVLSGIWVGMRLMERGRVRQANILGWGLVVCGATTFAASAASAKRLSDADAAMLEQAGILGGLAVLLFGLGMAKRHARRRIADEL